MFACLHVCIDSRCVHCYVLRRFMYMDESHLQECMHCTHIHISTCVLCQYIITECLAARASDDGMKSHACRTYSDSVIRLCWFLKPTGPRRNTIEACLHAFRARGSHKLSSSLGSDSMPSLVPGPTFCSLFLLLLLFFFFLLSLSLSLALLAL